MQFVCSLHNYFIHDHITINVSDPDKVALVIGIDTYDHRKELVSLPACRNDAINLSKILQKLEYTLDNDSPMIGSELDKEDGYSLIRKAILELFYNAKASQTIIFYFSGHGITKDGFVYLATPQINPRIPLDKGFSLDDLARAMAASKSKKIVGIIDACYAGSADLPSSERKNASKDNAELASAKYDTIDENIPEAEGKILLLSSQAYGSSLAKRDSSVYTKFLIEGLKGVKKKYVEGTNKLLEKGSVDDFGNITADSLHDYIYRKVADNFEQIPKIKGDRSSPVILATYPGLRDRPQIGKSSPNKKIQKIIDNAERLFQLNELSDSLGEFEKVLKENPKNVEALSRIGEIKARENKIEEAIRFFEKALEVDPKHIRAINDLGLAYLKIRKRKSANKCYDNAIKLNFNNATREPSQFQLERELKGKTKRLENTIIENELNNLRQRFSEARIPNAKKNNLRLLTWNIRAFGERKEDKAVRYIAEIFRNFDIVAIQEIKSNLGGLEYLQSLLGKNWEFLFSEVTGNRNRFAFAYNKSRVKFTGFASGIILYPGGSKESFPSPEFLRPPFMASFRINGCDFVLVNVHFRFIPMERRLEEIRNFSKYMNTFAIEHSLGADIIACGTTHLDTTGQIAPIEELTKRGFIIPKKMMDLPSTIKKTKSYVHIGYQKIPNSAVKFLDGGIIDFVGSVYENDPKLPWKFTDILPIWAEFKTKAGKSMKFLNP